MPTDRPDYTLARRPILTGGLALILGPFLAACETPPARRQFPEITFTHLPTFNLDVARIETIDKYQSAGHADDIAAQFPQAPERVVANWARDRLRAVGTTGEAVFTILSARATQTELPRTSGLTGALTQDQSDRYDLELAVSLTADNPYLGRTGEVTARTTRSQTVAEDMTLNEREAVLFEMLDLASRDLNRRLETAIPQYLEAFIR
jgi:hypothetical protein